MRVSDAGVLRRYHGTMQEEEDVVIDRFKPSPGNLGSVNRPSIGVTPAVYTSSDPGGAIRYGQGYNNMDEGRGAGQLYVVDIYPDTVVDLKDCKDDAVAAKAIEMGIRRH